MEDLSIPQELINEAEALLKSGFNLTVPPDAEAARKNGFARWTEVMTVESAHHEVVESKGNQHTVFALKMKVLPFNDSPNAGATYTVFNRINYASLGGSKEDGQYKMSLGAIRRLKQIAVAAGLDITQSGLSGELLGALFPEQGSAEDMSGEGSPLVGKRFVVGMRDNADPKKQYNGANAQEAEMFGAAAEE